MQTETNPCKGPVPIVIGVTGHRHIDAEQSLSLKSKVCEMLTTIKSKYADSDIILMSGLAIGADTICAEAAIETGCKLLAPLPMERAEYSKDFPAEELIKFNILADSAEDAFSVSPSFDSASSRDDYYVNLGVYLTKHSHLLLALWDGNESNLLPGSTSDVVRMAREKNDDMRKDPLSIAAAIPVLQLATNRANDPLSKSGELFLYNVDETKTGIEKFEGVALFDKINAFNSECIKRSDIIEKNRSASIESCIKNYDISKIKNGKKVLNAFVAADVLSIFSQKKRNDAIRNISLVALGIVLAFLLYDSIDSFTSLIVYGLLMIISATIYVVVRRRMWHEQYLLYRALAESLRIQLYMCIAGIEHSAYIPTWRLDDNLLFVLNSTKNFAVPIEGDDGIETIKECWIKDQLNYHGKSAINKRKKLSINDNLTNTLLVIAILFYFLVLIFEIALPAVMAAEIVDFAMTSFPAVGILTVKGLLKIILGILFAGVAFIANYFGKHALPEKIDNDEKLGALFELASIELEAHKDDISYTRAILVSLANTHVEEVINWYVYNAKNSPELTLC